MRQPADPAEQAVRDYHRRTKHAFERYAPGPETLDWEAQPSPFRHFAGAPDIPLPPFADCLQDPGLRAALQRPFAGMLRPGDPQPCTLAALGALLQLAFGITAWKSWGPERWAVRANPSSGNLHPVEVYLIAQGLDCLPHGLYHYRPERHALERRADLAGDGGGPALHIGLSSAMWREAWKYGERAFRYCQLDTGHAAGALAYAGALLGWPVLERREAGTATLAGWLGLDRAAEFPAASTPETEREEAEMLLAVCLDQLPPPLPAPVVTAWHGMASPIDSRPMYRWPVIEEVAAATRLPDGAAPAAPHAAQPTAAAGSAPAAVDIILGRRSAQRFDHRHVMPLQDFTGMLQAVLPQAMPPVLAGGAHVSLVLFVHRVQGLQPGLYAFARDARLAALLDAALDSRFLRSPVDGAPAGLGLRLLTPAAPAELQRAARALHCHQDIAATACFALGMLAQFDAVLAGNPAAYRDLHREAGLIGQVLYLEAEARGLRGTGIGCFFDDPVHQLLGLGDETFQTVYHFTVGLPLEDARIETQPILAAAP